MNNVQWVKNLVHSHASNDSGKSKAGSNGDWSAFASLVAQQLLNDLSPAFEEWLDRLNSSVLEELRRQDDRIEKRLERRYKRQDQDNLEDGSGQLRQLQFPLRSAGRPFPRHRYPPSMLFDRSRR